MNDNILTNNLANKVVDYFNIVQALTSQGFVVNKTKRIKNNWHTMLYDFSHRVQNDDKHIDSKLKLICNKLELV